MQPSHARHKLLAFTTILAIITYLDRVAISSAAPEVRSEMGLSAVQMGWVFSAFTWAYAAFEIPSGWMGDVMGPRKVLTRIVIWWSAFTAATGLAWNFASLVVARLLFGVGEAGAFPNTSRSFAKWFPALRAGIGPWLGVHGHAHGRRDYAADRRRVDDGVRMAADILHVRRPGRGVGVVLVAVVQGRTVSTSRGECRRACVDRRRRET